MYKPSFQLIADGDDITTKVQKDLISLTLTDKAGSESDRLAVSIAAPDMPVPSKGAVLRLSLGFDSELVSKGVFVVDEVTVSGPPRVIQIVAKAAPMDSSKQTAQLQTQKVRSWDAVTLSDLVRTVAGEHGLVAKVSTELSATQIDHLDQVNESDMNLLTRLGRQYGAISKPANGHWLFLLEGEGKSASGKALQVITLRPGMVSRYQARFSSRNDVKRVVATYYDTAAGETKEVSSGAGEPAFRIAFQYPNKAEAAAAVSARAKSVKAGADTLDVSLPATPELMSLVAEGHIVMDGFGEGEDGRWRLQSVECALSQSGFQIRLSGDSGVA